MKHPHAETAKADSRAAAKAALRRKMAARRGRLTAAERSRASAAIAGHLLAWEPLRRAARVALYAALPDEVDLEPLASACAALGKPLVLPRGQAAGGYEMAPAGATRPGRFGIREPLPEAPALTAAERCDAALVWLIPGLAFDPAGRRLGRGGGYYDRLLAGARGPRVGVAFSWQIVPRVPAVAHDQPMDWLATEDGLVRCSAAAGGRRSPPSRMVVATVQP